VTTEAPLLTDCSLAMSSLDVLPWEADLSLTSFGVSIALRCNDAAVLEYLLPQLTPLKEQHGSSEADAVYSVLVAGRPGADDCAVHRLFLGCDELLSTENLGILMDRLISDVHHQVAVHAQAALFVHAGVVGWQGTAILLPGPSRTGKSTLVSELVRAGAVYYSDEYAVLDDVGQVHPYPKRLSLRSAENGRTREFRSAEHLGGSTGTGPLSVGLIAVMRYEVGATWTTQPLAPGQALLALLSNTLLARSRPDAALHRFSRAVESGSALIGVRGESEETARYLLSYRDSCRVSAESSSLTVGRCS
jgi:hypothetical protein